MNYTFILFTYLPSFHTCPSGPHLSLSSFRLHAVCAAIHPEVPPLPGQGSSPEMIEPPLVRIKEGRDTADLGGTPEGANDPLVEGYFGGAYQLAENDESTSTAPLELEKDCTLANLARDVFIFDSAGRRHGGACLDLDEAVQVCVRQRIQMLSEQLSRLQNNCKVTIKSPAEAKEGVSKDEISNGVPANGLALKLQEEANSLARAVLLPLRPHLLLMEGNLPEDLTEGPRSSSSSRSRYMPNSSTVGHLLNASLQTFPCWCSWAPRVSPDSLVNGPESLESYLVQPLTSDRAVGLFSSEALFRLPEVLDALPRAIANLAGRLADQV